MTYEIPHITKHDVCSLALYNLGDFRIDQGISGPLVDQKCLELNIYQG